MPNPILSGCCASAVPVSASPMNRAPSTRFETLRTLLPSMVSSSVCGKIGAAFRGFCPRARFPPSGLSGDYESALLFVKRYPLPQPLAALEPGEHLDLEFPRPEAEALARALVEERAIGLQAEFAHPREQRLVGVAPGRAQDVGGLRSPSNRNDQHAQAVRLEFLRKGALLLQPPADEVPARIDRPAFVDAAAPLSAEVTRLARLHLVAQDRALDPAVAAGRAGAASPRCVRRGDRVDSHHRAAAPLVFPAAAARAGIVSSYGHRKSLAHALDLAHPCRSISSSFCRCFRASRTAAARCWCRWTRCSSERIPSWSAFWPRCMRFFLCCSRCTRAGSPTASACAIQSCSVRSASPRASSFRRCREACLPCFCARP